MWVTNLYIHVQLRYQLTTARFPLIFHVSMNFIPSKSITNSSLPVFVPFFLFTNSISRIQNHIQLVHFFLENLSHVKLEGEEEDEKSQRSS